VREELKLLVKLQALDLWLEEAEKLKKTLPQQIQAETKALEEAKRHLEKLQQELKALEIERRSKEREINELGEKVGEKKGRLFQAKSNEEYNALLKEIETLKERISQLEDEVILLLDRIEEVKAQEDKAREDVREKEEALKKAQAKAEEKLRETEKTLQERRKEREELSTRLNRRTYQIYEKVRQSRGYALVQAQKYTCLGCHMEIPPQVFLEVKKGEALIQCPFCNRILYYWEENQE